MHYPALMVPHTTTGEWQSFEIRMRHRRAERLALRAEIAAEAGCFDDARACLEEARSLAPGLAALSRIEQVLPPVSAVPAGPFATRVDPVASAPLHGAQTMRAAQTVRAAESVRAPQSVCAPQSVRAAASVQAGQSVRAAQSVRVADLRAANAPTRSHAVLVLPILAVLLLSGAAGFLLESRRTAAPVTATPAPGGVAQPSQPAVLDQSTGSPTAIATAPQVDPALSDQRARDAGPEPPSPVATAGKPDNLESPLSAIPRAPENAVPETALATDERAIPPVAPAAAAATPAPEPIGLVDTPALLPPPVSNSKPVAPIPSPPVEPAPVARPTTPPAAEPAADTLVRGALNRYAAAYSNLDVDAALQVWPGLNRAALARAFEGLAWQEVSLGECRVDVAAATAEATCAGTATWVPKVGAGRRTEPRTWTFALARTGTEWQIVRARVQNR